MKKFWIDRISNLALIVLNKMSTLANSSEESKCAECPTQLAEDALLSIVYLICYHSV